MQAAIDANGGAILLDVHAPDGTHSATRAGPVRGVSTDAAVVLGRADAVIFSVTGPAMDGLARELAPFLRPSQLLLYLQVREGALQGGPSWFAWRCSPA